MLEAFITIIQTVQNKITDDSDVVWTRYATPAELLADLDVFIQQLKAGNANCLRQLDTLFAPTGSFQELAISNGWGDEYIRLAEEFDKLYASMKVKD